MVYVAVLGHGVVGSGVVEILRNNAAHITHKAGEEIAVKRILDLRTFPELPYADLFTANFDDIVNDADIRIVVEAMGGLHPAYDFVKACLLAGKSVVTSNKELVAAKGDELLAIARQRNLNFMFEASVGGGIPILRPLDQCLAANNIEEIAGILNGTTNFMLTKMFTEGMDFNEALALAQQLGYAERNPDADILGTDACRKIAILTSLITGSLIPTELIPTEGIVNIRDNDVRAAAAVGCTIKLVARGFAKGKPYAIVAPFLVSSDKPLSGVSGVYNAVEIIGDPLGNVMLYGQGAGAGATASAVVGDLMQIMRMGTNCYLPVLNKIGDVADSDSFETRFYLAADKAFENVLCDAFDGAYVIPNDAEAVIITACMSESKLDKILLRAGVKPLSKIRVLD